ncbi:MAG: phosphatidate cytidylyltransferase [Streptosporangiales bacterium]|nr:phosphatidate cytidylyltransferase [Streptosporangiales bacterium]
MTYLMVQWMGGLLGAGGVGAMLSGQRELVRRWLTWVAIAGVLALAFWLQPYGPVALAGVVAAVCALEYGRLVALPAADRAVLTGLVAVAPVAVWLAPDLVARLAPLTLVAVALPAVLAHDGAAGGRRAAASAFGLAWLLPLCGLVSLGDAALPLVLAVCLADVTAWCGGRLLGGPALSRLSPAKTWGGVLGSAVGGTVVLALLGALSWPLAIAVVLGAPLGDLIESMVKRTYGVKDTGSWLPGFGGLLDRVDSLLVALAVAVVLS